LNPHPTRRPGAIYLLSRVKRNMSVSILTRSGGPAQQLRDLAQLPNPDKFQFSPDPEAGCNIEAYEENNRLLRVSILTRPAGRVQRRKIRQK
jgi:hypothetical protein